MQLGMIGLGRMGANIVRRLMKAGHECVVYDRDPKPGAALAGEGAIAASDLADLVSKLKAPRAIWVMLPAGEITEATLKELAGLVLPGDTLIDGGNAFWKDDVRRGKELAAKGLHYLDVGTSGGVHGLDRGYCLMIGGAKEAFDRLEPIFKTLAPGKGGIEPTKHRDGRNPRSEEGYLHCGPVGAGHFVKMVHNGIEYGMMQAFAEGFDLLRNASAKEGLPPEYGFDFDVAEVSEVWRRGSVVTSWLLDLTAEALAADEDLSAYTGNVSDSGEGRWTVEAALDTATPAEVLTSALYTRFRSRKDHTFAEKILSAMRAGFGGHVEPKKP
ncbi:decarboxylating 6-phosphogluconate dehydrogenase [Bosea caraganae]|uniref:Decarboxylating 6-phosphogluconate dehydrogenase n=1 Tax=Bosea caraganae TaxID=2763117 RepID=A0A370LCP3_9HYPH|nr:decarboxylating 6-phosphogluconate dehydrogenase [Bosea caraganae]RDJ27615.1 decarboxylating 6-phosphogluconate dehydrogenase [Bosea caraganae]RDJ29629.1 decarboxylating 6-phosphogluconate dehydrogenase [Bosea caraganae]